MRRVWLGLGWLLAMAASSPLYAQAVPTITGVKVDLYRAADLVTVVTSTTVPVAGYVCNLAPSPANAATINPTILEFDDPVTTGRVCRADIRPMINALVAGDYLAKATYQYSDSGTGGTSAASNPFTRFLYALLTNLRLVR